MNISILSLAVLLTAGSVIPTGNLEQSLQQLKDAASQKDAAQVKKLASETSALARQMEATPAPAGVEEKDAWEKNVAAAREAEGYTEYALYSTAAVSPAAAKVDLMSALIQQNPKSKYLDEGYGPYLVALSQTGAAKVTPAAEKGLANFPQNEDLLLVLADSAISRNQGAKALGYANRLVAVLSKHPKPANYSAADWDRKRSAALGRGHFIAGVVYSQKNAFYDADRELRAALPLIKGDESMMPTALFNLGVANYQIGAGAMKKSQVVEAQKYSEQAAAMGGPNAEQAWRNAQAIKAYAAKMR